MEKSRQPKKSKHFLGKDYYLGRPLKCPLCGHPADGASGIDHDHKPDPGDLAVCIGCASPLVYTDTFELRQMTEQEWNELHPDNKEQIRMAMATVRMIDRSKWRTRDAN